MSDTKVNKNNKYNIMNETILSIIVRKLDNTLYKDKQMDKIIYDTLSNCKNEDIHCPYCGCNMDADNLEFLYYNKKMLNQYITCINIELLKLNSIINGKYDLADKLMNNFTESCRNFYKILVKINDLRIKIDNK